MQTKLLKRKAKSVWFRFEHFFSGYPIVKEIHTRNVVIKSCVKDPRFDLPIDLPTPYNGKSSVTIVTRI